MKVIFKFPEGTVIEDVKEWIEDLKSRMSAPVEIIIEKEHCGGCSDKTNCKDK